MMPGDHISGFLQDPSAPDSGSGAPPDAAELEALVAEAAPKPAAPRPESLDLRNRTLLSAAQLRKLRLHQQGFVEALSSRFSLLLRLEFFLKLGRVQTISYRSFTKSWRNPSHFTLFKLDPLRGVSVLEIQPALASAIVDRLMGGPGNPADPAQEMSEIERALLEQAVTVILGEWSASWTRIKELRPALLGYETNGSFVQTAAPDTTMIVFSLEARLGECAEEIQIGIPYATIEPLIQQLTREPEPTMTAAPAPAPGMWNPAFNDVCIPVAAEWEGLELAARQVLNLKVGDVVKLDPHSSQQVKVRLGDIARFSARLGTVGGQWAVELTGKVKD